MADAPDITMSLLGYNKAEAVNYFGVQMHKSSQVLLVTLINDGFKVDTQ